MIPAPSPNDMDQVADEDYGATQNWPADAMPMFAARCACWIRRAVAAESACAAIIEHHAKTKAAAERRQREIGQDGFTIQLESEAQLLSLCLPGGSHGRKIIERLQAAEALSQAVSAYTKVYGNESATMDMERCNVKFQAAKGQL